MKITVAIVTRNRMEDLRECLESILQQTRSPEEILIIDNASNDDTRTVIGNYNNKIIKYIFCEKVGVSFARNTALNNCNGEIICFLDDDSIAEENWIFQNEKCFIERNDIIGIQGHIDNYYPNKVAAILSQFQRDLIEDVSVTNNKVVRPTFCAAGNLSFRMEFLNKYLLKFSTNLNAGEEQDLCRKIIKNNGTIFYLKKSVIYHKWKPNSLTFLRRRFKTGLSQAKQEEIVNNSCTKEYVSGYSKMQIFKKAIKYTSRFSRYYQFRILFLLILSNVVKKSGHLYFKYFK